MEEKLTKLSNLLTASTKNAEVKLLLKMYLAVVMLGYSSEILALYFNIPEKKIINGITFCHHRLLHNNSFRNEVKKVYKKYHSNQLELVA